MRQATFSPLKKMQILPSPIGPPQLTHNDLRFQNSADQVKNVKQSLTPKIQ
jgi:hypothetical protein